MDYIDRDTAIKTAIEMCVKVVGHGITLVDAVPKPRSSPFHICSWRQ